MKWSVEKDRGGGYRLLHFDLRQGRDARRNSRGTGSRGPSSPAPVRRDVEGRVTAARFHIGQTFFLTDGSMFADGQSHGKPQFHGTAHRTHAAE